MPFINYKAPAVRVSAIPVRKQAEAPEMSFAEYARLENAAMRKGQLHKTPPALVFGAILSRAKAKPGITTGELMLSLGMTKTAVLNAVRAMIDKGLVRVEQEAATKPQQVFVV